MLNVSQYISYFEGIATNHKEIAHKEDEKHFCRMNIEEVLTGLRSGILTPALILESFEGSLVDNKSDNILADRTGAFMILKKVEVDDFTQENEYLDDCERIGLEIIKRIRRDARIVPIQNRTPKIFNLNSVEWQKIGPLFDNFFGYRFTFKMSDTENMSYDKAKWLDEI